jgi:PAS domain S-box-containing protein
MKKAALSALVVAALAALAFLCLKVKAFSNKEHERFQTALWHLKHLDTAFNENVLEARFALADNYDELDSDAEQIEHYLGELKITPAFIDPAGQQAIKTARLEYQALLKQRADLFERFKSQNAMLANSRRYLPMALEELAARAGKEPIDPELESMTDDLTRLVLMCLATPDEAPAQAAARLKRIKDWCASHPDNQEAKFVSSLQQHARLIVTGNGEIDAMTRQILALPSEAAIQKLFQAYGSNVAKAIQRSQQYRAALYVLSFLVVAGIFWVFLALRSANRNLERRVHERTRDLARSEERFRTLSVAAPLGIYMADREGRCVYANPAWEKVSGLTLDQTLGDGWQNALHPEDRAPVVTEWLSMVKNGSTFAREFRLLARGQETRWVASQAAAIPGGEGVVTGFVGTVKDITAQKSAEKERAWMETKLRQSQKLESVGQLASGIAHEINTPIQYIGDNIRFIDESVAGLGRLMRGHQQLVAAVQANKVTPEVLAEVERSSAQTDIEYLSREIPLAAQQSLEGVARVAKIISAMKEFSHPGVKERIAIDLSHAIETTITVAQSEWKSVAEMVTDFDPDLPLVPCFPGDLNQVMLNLIVNAAHAIGDVVKNAKDTKGVIKISTRQQGPWAEIKISDTGAGIPEPIRHRIFDPFFTTKDVGKGTGQGLTIAWSTVVEKHLGQLNFESTVGQGTTFTVRLPIQPEICQLN